jgi:hypothetical protein
MVEKVWGAVSYNLPNGATPAYVQFKSYQLHPVTLGTLGCSTGLPNDLVSFGTDLQKWTALLFRAVNAIPSG